ncbi:MAG TPA: hypothetical protein VF950_28800 [Planctomycetota bacterium]
MRRGVSILLLAGCAGDPALECERYSASSAEGAWCAAHRNAVLRFVRSTTDVEGRRARLKWFRFEFYPAIAKTDRMDTIHELALSLEKEMPTFHRFYTQEHLWAVRDSSQMNPDLFGPLMKAGFRHAVVELERELHPARD